MESNLVHANAMAPPKVTRLEALPPEILAQIVALIPSEQQRSACSLVCRALRGAERATRTELKLRCSWEDLESIPCCFQAVKTLGFEVPLRSVNESNEEVRELRLVGETARRLAGAFPELAVLCLPGDVKLSEPLLLDLGQIWPHVRWVTGLQLGEGREVCGAAQSLPRAVGRAFPQIAAVGSATSVSGARVLQLAEPREALVRGRCEYFPRHRPKMHGAPANRPALNQGLPHRRRQTLGRLSQLHKAREDGFRRGGRRPIQTAADVTGVRRPFLLSEYDVDQSDRAGLVWEAIEQELSGGPGAHRARDSACQDAVFGLRVDEAVQGRRECAGPTVDEVHELNGAYADAVSDGSDHAAGGRR